MGRIFGNEVIGYTLTLCVTGFSAIELGTGNMYGYIQHQDVVSYIVTGIVCRITMDHRANTENVSVKVQCDQ